MDERRRLIWRVGRAAAAAVALVLLILWMSGAFVEKIPAGAERAVRKPTVGADASVALVQERTVPVFEEAMGTVQAERRTTVSARILATIAAVEVRAGDTVEVGDPLVRLDDAELRARVEEARQLVDRAAADQRRRAADLERARRLVGRGVISESEHDRATAAAVMADAELQRSRESLRRAEIALSYAVIESPVAGRVVDRLADPGDTASPGQPLLAIYDPTALRLEVPVRESLISKLQLGQEVDVQIGDTSARARGTIDEIVPQAETGSRTFLVKVRWKGVGRAYAGSFGRVFLPAGEKTRISIPRAAVARVGQLAYCHVVDEDGVLAKRLITLGGALDADHVEVLSGVRPGERVLLQRTGGTRAEEDPR